MITGVVLAKNEEHNISGCLESFRGCVDELILIDMESSDHTIDLARSFGARILRHPQVPNFDAARNIAIPEARFDWLWFCDADERVSPVVGSCVRELIQRQGHTFVALSIPFKTYFCGKWIEHCGWWPGYTMPRVLKRGHFSFRERLHGGVAIDGKEMMLAPDPRLGVDHYSYKSVEHYVEKFNRYTSIEAAQLHRDGQEWDWRAATRSMMRDLWTYYEFNKGSLDGAHGWILSWLSGQYRWVSQAKLIDSQSNSLQSSSAPKNLSEFVGEMVAELRHLRAPFARPPYDIHFHTPIYDPSGYAEEGRTFAKSLSRSERNVALHCIHWSDKQIALQPQDAALFRALANADCKRAVIAITNCIPSLVRPVRGATFNILRTTFETDRIPAQWIEKLEDFDEIWLLSTHNYRAFVRSGVAPEKLRVVPGYIDTEAFSPLGPKRDLPHACVGRFVFLSVFDWQLRKGWDVLAAAFVEEFSFHDDCCLLLKITCSHGQTPAIVRSQLEGFLAGLGILLSDRPDIVLWFVDLSAEEMPALYRSVDAFVLATRGEGLGRPYMEALACGLPVIGTSGSGNSDFMTESNSCLIDAASCDVPEVAANELPIFRGHRWLEPSRSDLRGKMKKVYCDPSFRDQLKATSTATIQADFSIERGMQAIESALREFERLHHAEKAPPPRTEEVCVEIQGDVFARHSFSNINERLGMMLNSQQGLACSIKPRNLLPAPKDSWSQGVASIVNRPLAAPPRFVIRHAYPPDWSPVENGRWIHIQPWEFGSLPVAWIEPLRGLVDEIWVPSQYVKRVYLHSGIPANKVHVMPWGFDDATFHCDAIPRLLPAPDGFRFIFVGGVVERKGFDVVLQAYLEEFSRNEDVALVVKDLGVTTVYRDSALRQPLLAAASNSQFPRIVYFDDDMTPGQLASLYRSCDCLVAPYRGEGFGLPVLEAMACGIPAIVPRGGPTDDFVDCNCGYVIPATTIAAQHPVPTTHPATELRVEVTTLRNQMRQAFEDRVLTRRLGQNAAEHVRCDWTWRQAVNRMAERLRSVPREKSERSEAFPGLVAKSQSSRIAVVMSCDDDGWSMAESLCAVEVLGIPVFVLCGQRSSQSAHVAKEYGATLVEHTDQLQQAMRNTGDTLEFYIWLACGEALSAEDWAIIQNCRISPGSTKATITVSNLRRFELIRVTEPQEA